MTTRVPGRRFRLLEAVWPQVRPMVLSALPVPDLPSRLKIRRAARSLAKGCDPWPGMTASGTDAARLALLRLLHLQREIHRAVRSRQDEAATMLARAAIETFITGMYCLLEPGAVERLQNDGLKKARAMLEVFGGTSGVPRNVLDECLQHLNAGTPAEGPNLKDMAERVDVATSTPIAINLYNRFYRQTSNFALHSGAAALLRHVRDGGGVTRRPTRMWGRRAPARIADTCVGGLTAYLSFKEGGSWQRTAKYADRHSERAIPPINAIAIGNLGHSSLRLSGIRQVGQSLAQLRELGEYIQSGQGADDPAVRTARIRSGLEVMLTLPGLDVPDGTLDPYLDFLTGKIVADGQPPDTPEGEVA